MQIYSAIMLVSLLGPYVVMQSLIKCLKRETDDSHYHLQK